MKCLACEWKRRNVTNLAFCPTCGSDADLADYADVDSELCSKSYAQPVDKPVDNFFEI